MQWKSKWGYFRRGRDAVQNIIINELKWMHVYIIDVSLRAYTYDRSEQYYCICWTTSFICLLITKDLYKAIYHYTKHKGSNSHNRVIWQNKLYSLCNGSSKLDYSLFTGWGQLVVVVDVSDGVDWTRVTGVWSLWCDKM